MVIHKIILFHTIQYILSKPNNSVAREVRRRNAFYFIVYKRFEKALLRDVTENIISSVFFLFFLFAAEGKGAIIAGVNEKFAVISLHICLR